MPWQCFPVIDSTLQPEGCTFQVWVKTDSDLSHHWFRSDSKLDSDLKCTTFLLQGTDNYREMASPFPGNASVPSNSIPMKKCESGFCHFGVPGKMHQICWSLARHWAPGKCQFHFLEPWIRGWFDSLFPEYDSLEPELDAMAVFSGNREAISQ